VVIDGVAATVCAGATQARPCGPEWIAALAGISVIANTPVRYRTDPDRPIDLFVIADASGDPSELRSVVLM
jgi:hypothetical protein